MLLWVLAFWPFHPRCLHVDWADYFGGSLSAYRFVFKVESTMHLRLLSAAWLPECRSYWLKPAAPVQFISDCTWWLVWLCYARTIPPWVKNRALGSPPWHATSESESWRVQAKTLVSDKVVLVLRPYSTDFLGIHNLLASVSQVIKLQGNFVPMWDWFLH